MYILHICTGYVNFNFVRDVYLKFVPDVYFTHLYRMCILQICPGCVFKVCTGCVFYKFVPDVYLRYWHRTRIWKLHRICNYGPIPVPYKKVFFGIISVKSYRIRIKCLYRFCFRYFCSGSAFKINTSSFSRFV